MPFVGGERRNNNNNNNNKCCLTFGEKMNSKSFL